MKGTVRGVLNINYQSYHQYLTSTGTVLLVLSYLAIFGYLTTVYSFRGSVEGFHIAFLALPAVAGIIMIGVGLSNWIEHQSKQNTLRDEELRQQKAQAKMAEQQAELLEKQAKKLEEGELSHQDVSIQMEDWNQ